MCHNARLSHLCLTLSRAYLILDLCWLAYTPVQRFIPNIRLCVEYYGRCGWKRGTIEESTGQVWWYQGNLQVEAEGGGRRGWECVCKTSHMVLQVVSNMGRGRLEARTRHACCSLFPWNPTIFYRTSKRAALQMEKQSEFMCHSCVEIACLCSGPLGALRGDEILCSPIWMKIDRRLGHWSHLKVCQALPNQVPSIIERTVLSLEKVQDNVLGDMK